MASSFWVWEPDDTDTVDADTVEAENAEAAALAWVDDHHYQLGYPEAIDVEVVDASGVSKTFTVHAKEYTSYSFRAEEISDE